MSTNSRIPLNVLHGNVNKNTDETDRIHIRMKEFENRCARWREDFFLKQTQNNNQQPDFNSISNNSTTALHKSYIEDSADGTKFYKIEFDIGDFKQNELMISTKENKLIIRGDRQVRAGASTETKTFNRELSVPDYVDLEKMNAFLNNDSGMLVMEAPIVMDKYSHRRSAFDINNNNNKNSSTRNNLTEGSVNTESHSHMEQNKSSSSSSHAAATSSSSQKCQNQNNQIHNTPELISGYPVYDNKEACIIYKFDFTGFTQSEIHLTITVDRTLEIKACKDSHDHLGKVYREFKREIQLEPHVDPNLIKNILFEGVLTLKIPKQQQGDNNVNTNGNNNVGFREFYTDDGRLAKLTSDFKGFSPEHVKIVLSANNVLKLNALQESSETAKNGSVKKECSRQYTLPAWIQPEQMRAIMSRDGVLTVDFTGKEKNNDERILIN